MVTDKRVKWGDDIDVSTLDPKERKRYYAAIRQRKRRKTTLDDPESKEA